MRSVLLAATALLALGVAPVAAGPEGASVVGGAATIQGQGGPAVIVNQSTNSAIINWNTFNIRANESGASISRAPRRSRSTAWSAASGRRRSWAR